MVRHTHRRRQTKGRRRHTRRNKRTQRGGVSGWFDFFSSPNYDDIKNLQQKLNMETDPEKKADIQEELSIAQAKQIKDRTVKQIKERGTQGNTGMGMGMGMGNTGMGMSSNSMGMGNTGMGMGNTGMSSYGAGNMSSYGARGGRRRRSHKRK